MSEGINCETVAVSPYSVFAGLPVSVWGVLGYLVLGALGMSALHRRRPHPAWPFGLLLLLTLLAAAVSAVLAYISATRIDSVCLFCTASYAINAALLGLAVAGVGRSRVTAANLLLADARALLARPGEPFCWRALAPWRWARCSGIQDTVKSDQVDPVELAVGLGIDRAPASARATREVTEWRAPSACGRRGRWRARRLVREQLSSERGRLPSALTSPDSSPTEPPAGPMPHRTLASAASLGR